MKKKNRVAMSWHKVLSLALLICALNGVQSDISTEGCDGMTSTIPDKFEVRRDAINFWKRTVRIAVGDRELFRIDKHCPSSDNWDVDWYDNQGNTLMAHTYKDFFTWAVNVHFYDCKNREIFRLTEDSSQVLVNRFWIETEFEIYNMTNQKIGYSKKTGFFDKEITISDIETGTTVLKAFRPFFQFTFEPKWDVEIYNRTHTLGDPRLIGMILAAKQFFAMRGSKGSSLDLCTTTLYYILPIIGGIILCVVCCCLYIKLCRRGDDSGCDCEGCANRCCPRGCCCCRPGHHYERV
eukprot:TRINITY_DN4108_c0_g1_i1.p2 TRINITY_DN4108_c0_g1~~TRINITY_DN4108_c0_g1_i1.p2  ORF type:complete len:294 (+),score=39.99 TRINITY_DN4108_c0_g1_i1:190-1071(+)